MAGQQIAHHQDAAGRASMPVAGDAALLARALNLARMGYWKSDAPEAVRLWISPELAALYRIDTDAGMV